MQFKKKVRNFELKLGKVGIVVFTLGVSCLLLMSFVFGVMVGKNIETYPGRITGVIPGLIRDKVLKTPVERDVVTPAGDSREAGKGEKDETKLAFYGVLAGKGGGEVKETLIQSPPEEKPPVREKAAAPGKTETREGFIVQVASLKDEEKATNLHKKLINMGYQATIDARELSNGGKVHRVRLGGFETREEADKAADAVQKKMKVKCMVRKID